MKVLVVCSLNSGKISPFIKDQVDSLSMLGITFDYYGIIGKGALGYISNLARLRKKIKTFKPDLVHAHYGLSGFLANLQKKVPVITTFHGSDVNNKLYWVISFLASKLSVECIFVNPNQVAKIGYTKLLNMIPCGVDLNIFEPRDKHESRKLIGLDKNGLIILFGSNSENPVKNYQLAKKVIQLLELRIKLIELKGYTRKEVNLLMNACDLLLITSTSETGPLVVKEAAACNCPIVSTDIGDVRWVIGNNKGCYLTSFDPVDIASNIQEAIRFVKDYGKTDGRERIIKLGLDSETTSGKIKRVYERVILQVKK
jgi:teichuronic acid biosynthesis glycosyltransferase TuaC